MKNKDFFVADPYNGEHLEKMTNFESINQLSHSISNHLKELGKHQEKENLGYSNRFSNEMEQIFCYQKGNQMIERCYLRGEKDIKTGFLTFEPLIPSDKSEAFINEITSYAFSMLGLEEIFIQIPTSDKKRASYFVQSGFTSLGEDNSMISFVKGKEEEKEMSVKL